jgi:hypothetical protein
MILFLRSGAAKGREILATSETRNEGDIGITLPLEVCMKPTVPYDPCP